MAGLPDIISGIDAQNQVRIEIEVQGLYKSLPFGAILDTGFSGGLLLPTVTAVMVGLESAGGGNVVLADGTIKTLPIFLCKVKVGNVISDVSTIVMGNDVLIGMELMDKLQVCINAATGVVTVVPSSSLPTQPAQGIHYDFSSFSRLSETIRRLT